MPVRRIDPGEWRTLRDIRLRALADAPEAFGATLAEASALSDADWQARADPPDSAVFVADGPESLIAMVIGGPAPAYPEIAAVFSMWVAPEVRGQGVGEALIDAVKAWAKAAGYPSLGLGVTSTNVHAIALYERLGFVDVGDRYPLREGTDLEIQIMVIPLS
jgi:ribosomal protein S18 acetylase RimI-like enzyme